MPNLSLLLGALLISVSSAQAALPPDGIQSEQSPSKESKLYSYRTNADLALQGLVAGENSDQEALPIELFISRGTNFRILDRRINEDNDYFAKIELDTENESGARLTYWVDEHELVKSLYSTEPAIEDDRLTLDSVSTALANFEYTGDGVRTAGPDGFIMPIKNARRTSPPGMRMHPILKRRHMHAGWDFAAPKGTPVYAAADGNVIKAGWGNGYGNVIYLNHGKIETRYAHLSRILVRLHQKVKQAQEIGKVGSTGQSTGNHLHYERRGPGGSILDIPPGRR